MVLINKFFHVIEKTPKSMTSFFRVTHLCIITVSVITALVSAYYFANVVKAFGFNCFLYANLNFTNGSSSQAYQRYGSGRMPEESLKINHYATIWGSATVCNFVHFSILTAGIFAFIWGAFLVICGNGGSGKTSDELAMPWRIVFPAFAFTAIYWIFIFESHAYLMDGSKAFCKEFEPVFNVTQCSDRIDVYTLHFNKKVIPFHSYLNKVKLCSSLCMWSWVVQLVILAIRFFTGQDFKILVVSVYSKDHVFLNTANASSNAFVNVENNHEKKPPKHSKPTVRKRRESGTQTVISIGRTDGQPRIEEVN